MVGEERERERERESMAKRKMKNLPTGRVKKGMSWECLHAICRDLPVGFSTSSCFLEREKER